MHPVPFVLWALDTLLKVFPSPLPPPEPAAALRLAAAGGEHESAQLALRAATNVAGVRAVAGELVAERGRLPAESVRCQWVGYVQMRHNTPATPADELLVTAPAEVPDVLLDDATCDLVADRTQALWITVRVPRGTPAGEYRGVVTIAAGEADVEVPLILTVYGFDLPEQRRLRVTNWFTDANIARAHGLEAGSDAGFAMLGRYAELMAEHGQNVFWLSPFLVRGERAADGRLSWSFAAFDRTVELFLRAGVDRGIELQPVAAHGEGGWSSTEIRPRTIVVRDAATGQNVELAPEEGLGPMLAALERHLDERGWLERAMIHICDEPAPHNLDSYRAAADFVHRWAPRLKRIEALETTGLDGALEILVPKLSHLRNWYPWFNARRDAGELWYYICCHPTGRWPNRFLDGPLTKVRVLHWLNWRYRLSGYLHWGLNFWGEDPRDFANASLPPGDTHVVYPGAGGPLASLRLAVQRDSLEDFDYLCALEDRVRAAAAELGATAFDPRARSDAWCGRIVRDFLDFERDPAGYAAARAGIAAEIAELEREPRVLWTTLPDEATVLVPGPIVLDVRGVTRPGATVTVNGQAVPVKADGSFHAGVPPFRGEVALELEHGGRRQRQARRFETAE